MSASTIAGSHAPTPSFIQLSKPNSWPIFLQEMCHALAWEEFFFFFSIRFPGGRLTHMAPPSEDSASGRLPLFTCHRPSAGRVLGERPLPALRAVSWHHVQAPFSWSVSKHFPGAHYVPDSLGPSLTLLVSCYRHSSPLPCRKQGPDLTAFPRVLIELSTRWVLK